MNPRDRLIRNLEDYISEKYEGPTGYYVKWKNRKHFIKASYEHWAAHEFVNYLKRVQINTSTTSSIKTDIFRSANRYIDMVNEFACLGRKNREIFEIAFDVASDLLDFIRNLYL